MLHACMCTHDVCFESRACAQGIFNQTLDHFGAAGTDARASLWPQRFQYNLTYHKGTCVCDACTHLLSDSLALS